MNAIVIGAGVAGLAAAYRLARAGEQVTVVEASDRLGGMVRSVRLAGEWIDAGAEAFAQHHQVLNLCSQLQLTIHEPLQRPRIRWSVDRSWVAADGMLGIPASPHDPALRQALEDQDLAVARAEPYLPAGLGADAASLGELVTTRLGSAVTERLVAPLTRGIFNREPDQVPLAQMAPALMGPGSLYDKVTAARSQRSRIAQPAGGLYRLVEALAFDIISHGGEIRLNQPVTGLRPGWQVQAEELLHADRVVIACPGEPATELLRQIGVPVAAPATSASTIVLLAVPVEALAVIPPCSGILLGRPIPGLTARALTVWSAKWPGDHNPSYAILRVSYAAVVTPTPRTVLTDAALLLGCRLPRVADSAVIAWPAVPRSLSPADRAELVERLPDGIRLAGAWVFGNGIEAALTSGLGAAS